MNSYIPKQGDIVWIDFSPSQGREIKHRRPAIVLSRDEYNNRMGFVIVAPINSTIRNKPIYYTLDGYKTDGQISTHQIYTLDYTPKANRWIEFIEKIRPSDFAQIMQLVNFNFSAK